MDRNDPVEFPIGSFTYSIKSDGTLYINAVRYDRETFPELYEIVYAYADLEQAYKEDV